MGRAGTPAGAGAGVRDRGPAAIAGADLTAACTAARGGATDPLLREGRGVCLAHPMLIDKGHHMTPNDTSRRDFFRVAAAGAVAASAVAVSANGALAYQGNMEAALASLHDALASLR